MRLDNFKKDTTTVLGIIFLLADLFYWIYPLFAVKEIETSYMIMLVGALIGLGLMFAPNDLYGLLKKKAEEKKL